MAIRLIVLALLLIGGTGCNRSDGEKLVRISELIIQRARSAAPSSLPFQEFSNDPIARRVRQRLENDVYLNTFQIDVQQRVDGLYLSGTVPDEDFRKRANDLAISTVGVLDVINQIQVQP